MRPRIFSVLMILFLFSWSAAAAVARPFILAVLEKEKAYVGEPVRVDYFLYSQVHPGKVIIRHYPAFDDFIKRFYFPDDTPRQIDFKGKKYWRSLHYQVRLFPLATGRYKLDSLSLEVELSPHGTPLKTIARNEVHASWQKIEVNGDQPVLEVLPLPAAPTDFFGLVGKHEFNVTRPTQDAQVNNPVKFIFEVKGTGSLEKFEVPELFHHESLELLEKTSDFSENATDGIAVKRVTLTYLPKKPIEIEARTITFSWFEPIGKTFENTSIVIGPLLVGKPRESDIAGTARPPHPVNFAGSSHIERIEQKLDWIVAILWGVGSLFLFALWWKQAWKERDTLSDVIKQIRQKGFDYSRIHLLFTTILAEEKSASLSDMLEKLNLSVGATVYFREAIAFAERVDYSKDKKRAGPLFVRRYFRELRAARKMTSGQDENIQDD